MNMTERHQKNIVYCGFGWSPNIGNAFVDMGIKHQLELATKNHKIIGISNTNSFLKARYSNKGVYRFFKNKSVQDRNFDLRTVIDSDIVALGGALLNINWMRSNDSLIKHLINNQKKVIIIGGGGGNTYNKVQKDYLAAILERLNLIGMITRDEQTYESYNKYADICYNGIDSAFFIDDVFSPAKIHYPSYVLSVFDFLKEPKEIRRFENVIRLDHNSAAVIGLNDLLRNPYRILSLMGRKDWVSAP